MAEGRRRLLVVAVAVAVLGLPGAGAGARAVADGSHPPFVVDGHVGDWVGTSTGLGGTWQLSKGELVYQDHLFDDLGPDTNQRATQHGTVGNPKGDYRYPDDEERYGYNATDLQELRLAADHDALRVLARLSTYKDPTTTVVAIGVDTDHDEATGGQAWPHAAGIAARGVDTVITLWGTSGDVTDLATGQVVALGAGQVAASTADADNAIEAAIPRAMFGAASTVRVWAATGLWDGAGFMAVPTSSCTDSTPCGGSPLVTARVWNVAFRPGQSATDPSGETGSYMEEQQAAALAKGDITPFSAEVDLSDLERHVDRPYAMEAGRFYDVIIDTGFTVTDPGSPPRFAHTEGVSYAGEPGRFQGVGGKALTQKFEFYGRHQPYGLYVPSTYDGHTPLPAALALHGIGGSFSGYNTQPGFIAQMGEGQGTAGAPPMYLITPLARGGSFYADYGEADTLAALRDMFERVPVDRERLYLTGYSMGGYGVYRLASLYPDLFAASAVWAGYSGEFTGSWETESLPPGPGVVSGGAGGGGGGRAVIGDPVDALANLRHLPLLEMAGTNDEIVPTAGQYAVPHRLAELGYRSRWDLYAGYEHFSFALVDDWTQARAWLGDQHRAERPRTVDYTFSDGWTAPGVAGSLGLTHGNAWWLHDLQMRDHTDDGLTTASAQAVSHAVPERLETPVSSSAPAASPTPHVEQLVSWVDGAPLATANQLELSLRGVGAGRVDLAAAGLAPCGLTVSITTDGPTDLTLSATYPATVVTTLAGATITRTAASVQLHVTGSGTGTISCPSL